MPFQFPVLGRPWLAEGIWPSRCNAPVAQRIGMALCRIRVDRQVLVACFKINGTPCVGTDQQAIRMRVLRAPHAVPPAPDAPHGKTGRVVVATHVHPALIVRQVVHPVGDSLAPRLVGKVMRLDGHRLTRGLPVPTAILVTPHQLLVLRIHRNHDARLLARRSGTSAGGSSSVARHTWETARGCR